MFGKARGARDAFKFSLGGMTTISSFVAPWAVTGDYINRAIDSRLAQAREDQQAPAPGSRSGEPLVDQPGKRRPRLRLFRRAA